MNSFNPTTSIIRRRFNSFSAFRVLLYSTETATSSIRTSNKALYRRISPAGDPTVSIKPALDQWIEEGQTLKKSELQHIIKRLRNYKRFSHALQVSEWMSDRMNFDLSAADVAVRLDLISKVHGLKQVEEYFCSIPDSLKIFQVYGALLNCYAHNKSLVKAEDQMQKMRDLGFLRTTLPYNVMLKLYSQLEQYEKLDVLMQEMEEKGIAWDKFTLNIRLNAYVAVSDIDRMEKLLMKMEADPEDFIDWHAYVVTANGYLKAGLIEKASAALKKGEQLIRDVSKRSAYEILLTLYTSMGQKDEVYRIWDLYKSVVGSYNSGYLCAIGGLLKLDDIDGAEKILQEWESGSAVFDFRVPNLFVSAYCKKGLLENAEALINRYMECGKEPIPSTWDRLATGYYMHNQMAKSVETMKKAILISRPGWKPSHDTLAAGLEFLKVEGHVEELEELIRLLREQGHVPTDTTN